MSRLTDEVAAIETKLEPLSPMSVRHRISGFREEDHFEDKAEDLAFHFAENCENNDSGWGRYYGPMGIFSQDDGQIVEVPGLSHVSNDILEYWKKRARSCAHPVLRARYAGLIWELSEFTVHSKPDFDFALLHIESLIEACAANLCEQNSIEKLYAIRAYQLARRINHKKLKTYSIDNMLAVEARIGELSKPGLCGFCFDNLEGDQDIDPEVWQTILAEEEQRMARLAERANHWACDTAAVRLAEYYRSKSDIDSVRRVIELSGQCFENAAAEAAPMLASSWYQHIHERYVQFNLHDLAQAVTRKIADIGPNLLDDMERVQHRYEVTSDQIESFVSSMIDEDLERSIGRLVAYFIPNRDQVEAQMREVAEDSVLSFLVEKTVYDRSGRPVSKIGGLSDDLGGNIVHHMSQNIGLSAVWLHFALDRLVESHGLSAESFTQQIFKAPIFLENKRSIVQRGIEAYLSGDYVATCHLLVPQVEAAVRQLLEGLGKPVLVKNHSGGLKYRPLDVLLSDDAFRDTFGEDTTFFFRVLLTDQRGFNLRNDICHGIPAAEQFTVSEAEWILCLVLVLACVRLTECESTPEEVDERGAA